MMFKQWKRGRQFLVLFWLLITQIFLVALIWKKIWRCSHMIFTEHTNSPFLVSLAPAAQRVKWLVSFGRRPPAVSLRGAQTLTGPDNYCPTIHMHNTNTTQIRHKYKTNTKQVQNKYITNTTQIQHKYNKNAQMQRQTLTGPDNYCPAIQIHNTNTKQIQHKYTTNTTHMHKCRGKHFKWTRQRPTTVQLYK